MKSNKYLLICLPCPSCIYFILSDFPSLKCTMFGNHTLLKVGKQKKRRNYALRLNFLRGMNVHNSSFV